MWPAVGGGRRIRWWGGYNRAVMLWCARLGGVCGVLVLLWAGPAALTAAGAAPVAEDAGAARVAEDAPVAEVAVEAGARRSAASLRDPASVEDLRLIEARVRQVVADRTGVTVCVRIGGASGSGVVVDPEGTVLTAAHVSGRPGRKVTVIFPDGSRREGRTLGHDARQDAGMIRITDPAPEGGWPWVPLAEVEPLVVGDWVVAMGHPGGFDRQRPMVARLGRVQKVGFGGVVTDCTLLGGDSGGPLFDLDGRLVAIHSRIGLSTRQNMHAPVSVFVAGRQRMAAGEVWNQWELPAGDVDAPLLGVAGRDHVRGVEVMSVVAGSAAEAAGIAVGDVITGIDGRPVADEAALVRRIATLKVGQSVRVALWRADGTRVVDAMLGSRRQLWGGPAAPGKEGAGA